MPLSVWARGDSSSAANASLNASNTNQQPTTLLTFVADSVDTDGDGEDDLDGDLKLNFTLDGSVDPNTVIYLDTNGDGTPDTGPISFTMEFGGTLPSTNKLSAVGPNNTNLQGEEIVILTLDTGERFFFLRSFLFDPDAPGADTQSQDTFDIMDDFPNGAHDISGIFVCYLAGTLIDTPDGPVKVEQLKVGDLVAVEHNLTQKILFTGTQSYDAAALRVFPSLCPVVVAKNTIAKGTPTQDLLVSQNHRVLVRDPDLSLLFGLDAAFVEARNLPYARRTVPSKITYVHILCENHSVITANGCESETLFPGDVALAAVTPEDRTTIRERLGVNMDQKTAYPCLTSSEAAVWRDAVYSREKCTA